MTNSKSSIKSLKYLKLLNFKNKNKPYSTHFEIFWGLSWKAFSETAVADRYTGK